MAIETEDSAEAQTNGSSDVKSHCEMVKDEDSDKEKVAKRGCFSWHQGKKCGGRTPIETLIDRKEIWKEKFIA